MRCGMMLVSPLIILLSSRRNRTRKHVRVSAFTFHMTDCLVARPLGTGIEGESNGMSITPELGGIHLNHAAAEVKFLDCTVAQLGAVTSNEIVYRDAETSIIIVGTRKPVHYANFSIFARDD